MPSNQSLSGIENPEATLDGLFLKSLLGIA